MEVDPLIVGSSDDESKVVKLSDTQKYAEDVLDSMASQGSQIFNTLELLGMEKIHDKLIRIGVAHLTSTKQCDIRSFVSSERSLYDLNDILWCALELDSTFKNIEVSYLLFSFLHCHVILIFYLFFENVTLCTMTEYSTMNNGTSLRSSTTFGMNLSSTPKRHGNGWSSILRLAKKKLPWPCSKALTNLEG